MTLGWLYWNPDKFIFTLPVIDRPIAWYGFFFVIGFIIGYFIMMKMVLETFKQAQFLAERDIYNWPNLINSLKSKLPKLFTTTENLTENLTKKNKDLILQKINDTLSTPNPLYSRSDIDRFFPKSIYSLQELAVRYTDTLTWLIILGTIIGARLGHAFFYEWDHYTNNPMEIIKVWEGGLASHGGTIGVILSLILFRKWTRNTYPEIGFLNLLDNVCVPSSLVAVFIRMGNFFNQEILGTKSSLPWAIIFGNPSDGSGVYPRHPVQLYEAISYLFTFFILSWLWINKRRTLKPGFITGLFFVLVFGSRFFMEYFKVPMGSTFDESFLQTGQMLSIPLILAGLWLMIRK